MSGEFPSSYDSDSPALGQWIKERIREHGWGYEEGMEVIRILEDYAAVLQEHKPAEVSTQGISAFMLAMHQGDLEKMREAARMMGEDARRGSSTGEEEA